MPRKEPPLAVEYREVDRLIPYIRNARKHSEDQIAQIAGSIREFGFNNPILVDGENGVIAGHGRLLAARKLGMQTVPCIELAGLSEIQKKAYIITDNQLAINAEWDNDLLRTEIEELTEADFDLGVLGFSEDELTAIVDGEMPSNEELGLSDEGETTAGSIGSVPHIHYDIVFDTDEQFQAWIDFIKWMRARSEGETFGEKLLDYIRGVMEG